MKWHCPVCGLDLTKYADRAKEGDTIKDTAEVLYTTICPCCGIQFGAYGDMLGFENDREFYQKWRQKWIEGGMLWEHQDKDSLEEKPQNWDPKKQLENIPQEFR